MNRLPLRSSVHTFIQKIAKINFSRYSNLFHAIKYCALDSTFSVFGVKFVYGIVFSIPTYSHSWEGPWILDYMKPWLVLGCRTATSIISLERIGRL